MDTHRNVQSLSLFFSFIKKTLYAHREYCLNNNKEFLFIFIAIAFAEHELFLSVSNHAYLMNCSVNEWMKKKVK